MYDIKEWKERVDTRLGAVLDRVEDETKNERREGGTERKSGSRARASEDRTDTGKKSERQGASGKI
jgi:hypothetical protein